MSNSAHGWELTSPQAEGWGRPIMRSLGPFNEGLPTPPNKPLSSSPTQIGALDFPMGEMDWALEVLLWYNDIYKMHNTIPKRFTLK